MNPVIVFIRVSVVSGKGNKLSRKVSPELLSSVTSKLIKRDPGWGRWEVWSTGRRDGFMTSSLSVFLSTNAGLTEVNQSYSCY